MNVLLIDNFDSFTFMLKDYILQCGVSCEVLRNNVEPDVLYKLKFDALVISPGPETPNRAGNLMHYLSQYVESKPILGICLGHQAIGQYFNATLQKAIQPRHGKADQITHRGNDIFKGIPQKFIATRYHSLVIDNLAAPLEIIATSNEGEVMGIKHQSLPIWGIQFHPESCKSQYGINIIKNFLDLAGNIE